MRKEDRCRAWASKHKKELYERSGGLCERCKETINIEESVIHHITYERKLESMLIIHKKCHVIIHHLQEEKNFLKKMIKWLNMRTTNSKKELIKEALEILLELNNDKQIPENTEKHINTVVNKERITPLE